MRNCCCLSYPPFVCVCFLKFYLSWNYLFQKGASTVADEDEEEEEDIEFDDDFEGTIFYVKTICLHTLDLICQ